MIRRRPIPKFRVHPPVSQHYELILDGAVRRYFSDGREVCQDSPSGWREYSRRIDFMLERQGGKCCLCGKRIRSRHDVTFEHQRRRGMAGWKRNDSVEGNGAAHWLCNTEKG